jgi:hypothetical protein
MALRAFGGAAIAACAMVHSAAAEDFIQGVYLQSEELCARAGKESLQAVIEAGNLALTAKGLDGADYNCEFVGITKASRSPAWLVHAVCQEPGYVFPDVLTIYQMSPTELELVSVKPEVEVEEDSEDVGSSENEGTYHLCPGVAAP